ncbi:hypothetical protein Tco_1009687 [Tanacetum coccineum]
MKIPDWMISDEMKHTEHYWMYAEVFGIHVPLTQSQPIESTQGMHRTPSAPRRSTRLTPPALVPTIDKADEMILQDTLQVSLAEHKSREEQEARENVELVNKHLASEEIEKLVEGFENVIDDSLPPRNDEPQIPVTRIEARSDKEKGDEITDEVYELKQRENGKIVEESRSTPSPTLIRSPRIHTNLVSLDTEKLQELTEVMVESLPTVVDKHIKEQAEKQVPENYMSGHILHVHLAQPQTTSFPEKQYQPYLSMNNNPQLQQQDIAIWLALQMKFETLQVPQTTCRTFVVRPRDQDDPHDDAPPEGENSAKRQKTSEYKAHVIGELSELVDEREQSLSSSGNQKKVDNYDFWTESYALDNDEIPMNQVSQDITEEVSLTINAVELKKIADEMLRQRCTLGDEHQYHIDQMKNFLKSDIVWESKKEIIASPHP